MRLSIPFSFGTRIVTAPSFVAKTNFADPSSSMAQSRSGPLNSIRSLPRLLSPIVACAAGVGKEAE